MARYCRTEALVLKSRDVRETDLLVALFTKEFGRLDVLAVSARKAGSKLRAHLECLAVCEVMFAEGRNRRLLTEARPIASNRWMFRSLEHAACALRASSMLERALTHEERDEALWNTVLSGVEELGRSAVPFEQLSEFRRQILCVLGYGSVSEYTGKKS